MNKTTKSILLMIGVVLIYLVGFEEGRRGAEPRANYEQIFQGNIRRAK